MFTITTLNGVTRNLMDIADAIEEEGKLGTGGFRGDNNLRCAVGVAIDCPIDDDTYEKYLAKIESLGWGMHGKLSDTTNKYFGNSLIFVNDTYLDRLRHDGDIDKPQKRAKFMASVFRQLAWYEEDGGKI